MSPAYRDAIGQARKIAYTRFAPKSPSPGATITSAKPAEPTRNSRRQRYSGLALGLGACLADDMGLGKTIQVLALLLTHRGKGPSLLVAPASLLANWAAEIDSFAPDLRALIVHPSAMPADRIKQLDGFDDIDLVITSYGTLLRLPVLTATDWNYMVLDEAQAIKNPKAKQTKAVKSINAAARIALTGTPVETPRHRPEPPLSGIGRRRFPPAPGGAVSGSRNAKPGPIRADAAP